MDTPWRVVVHQSRYSGVYEGGKWFALYIGDVFPDACIGNDVECANFFGAGKNQSIGVGNTPNDAVNDLLNQEPSIGIRLLDIDE
jgi:hypothetical protein